MGSLNKATILGHLGSDPDVRTTSTGALVVTLSVATSENWTDKQTGEKRQRTEWHRVVIFNQGLAKIARDYLRKGAQVYLEGQLQTRNWTTDDGTDRYTTEVTLQAYRGVLTMLGAAANKDDVDDANEDEPTDKTPTDTTTGAYVNGSAAGTDLDDEIPF
tara:strand:+ start:3482 stop:3961 length:480 start_codon:yes stop_codon:yes gene_type:complete